MTDEIEWADPPPKRSHQRPPGAAQQFLAELQKRPGDWAVYKRGQKHASAGQRLRDLGAQVSYRKQDDGTWDCYARWTEDDD